MISSNSLKIFASLALLAALAQGCAKAAPGADAGSDGDTVFRNLVISADKPIAPPAVAMPPHDPFLDDCRPGPNPPVAQISGAKEIFQLEDINHGLITLEAKEAREAGWTVMGPVGDPSQRLEFFTGTKLTLKLDAPGEYMVSVVAKDERGVCGPAASARFGVTVNVPFNGPRARPALAPNVATRFAHLSAIGAPAAWERTRGAGAKIAVLDTGVNYNHVDLSANILTKDGHVVGHDFADDDDQPFDDNGHGTHVAGLAAGAEGGVAPEASIIPVKVLDAKGDGRANAISNGIRFAVDEGADILVLSFNAASEAFAAAIRPAFDYAAAHGALLVVSAGNDGRDIDETPSYPASFKLPNVISVAAVGPDGGIARFSNRGKLTVDLAAPGGGAGPAGLLSAGFWPSGADQYVRHTGTSMAAPVVAGAAALLKAVAPSLDGVALKRLLTESVHMTPSLRNHVISSGTLDVAAAMERVGK
jgi:subtilisin family serine protease